MTGLEKAIPTPLTPDGTAVSGTTPPPQTVYELDGVEIIKLSPDGRYIFNIEGTRLNHEQLAIIHTLLSELFNGERPFVLLNVGGQLKVMRLDKEEEARPSLPQTHRGYLLELADVLDRAGRIRGGDMNRMTIVLTDELAREISQNLREIAQGAMP